MSLSEDTLASWSNGPAPTEATKCQRAENAVRAAIDASDELSDLDITVFPQGSYHARTNVRQDSDVDICVRYNEAYFVEYPLGKTDADFKVTDSPKSFADFKNMVQRALEAHFGEDRVTRGNKAFDIHANTYHIDADVVPTFEHRRYELNADGSYYYLSGVAFRPDDGSALIKNWPDQNYKNGVQKNSICNRRYKRVVRILKRLCYKMRAEDISIAKDIGSFLVECLVWNAPNEAFTHDTYTEDVRHVLAHLWNNTQTDATCSEWGEVNELKYLFRSAQPWTREKANSFLQACWDYIGYK